jgi:hypothetical protein
MRLCNLLVAALVLVSAPTARTADEPSELKPQDRPEAFRKLDADGDGYISEGEAAAHPDVAANFKKADVDHDGKLNLEEFETIALNRTDQPSKGSKPDRA